MQVGNTKRIGSTIDIEVPSKKPFKNFDNVSVNEYYFNSEFINKFSKAKLEAKDVEFSNNARYYSKPFPCCSFPQFINSSEFVECLKRELMEVKMHNKNSDLFQFKQSDDLANNSSLAIQKLIKILYTECLPWIEKLTGATLTEEIDITCSLYEYTDILLCHDDMLKGRRIAYIYYLVPDWEIKDGGLLDIFETEDDNAGNIAFSILPALNNFVFFEVSPSSFHQVAEVLSKKSRLSVNGWFHSNDCEILPKEELIPKILTIPGTLKLDELTDWVNPIYFDMKNSLQIKKDFEETSEIELPNFLKADKYELVVKALKDTSLKWNFIGPRNKKYFQESTELPSIVKKCTDILHSEEMCYVLSNLTGLPLHPLADISSSSESDESDSESSDKDNKQYKMGHYHSLVRRWSPGCYTLLHDGLLEGKSELDTILYFDCDNWNYEHGGFTSYFAKGETEELLRITPKSNSLGLVYTDEETSGFVKYINNDAHSDENGGIFYDICTTFYEQK